MAIASIICLILGIVLIIVSAVLFFKLNVREAFRFINHKRSNTSGNTSVKAKPRKYRRQPISVNNAQQKPKTETEQPTSKPATFKPKQEEKVIRDESSELPTDILSEDSEQPTGVLIEESEQVTGLLVEDSEQPTGVLIEESEQATGILIEDSENETGLLETSENPTTLLDEEDSVSFKFDFVKNIVVVHTIETID